MSNEAIKDPFYESREWQALRYSVLRDSGGRCECCGRQPEECGPLHVDHIKPRSRYPQLELERDNLQVLCGDCNIGKSNTDNIDWRLKDSKKRQLLLVATIENPQTARLAEVMRIFADLLERGGGSEGSLTAFGVDLKFKIERVKPDKEA